MGKVNLKLTKRLPRTFRVQTVLCKLQLLQSQILIRAALMYRQQMQHYLYLNVVQT